MCQIKEAFQVLIKNKIMHRDLKLENVLMHNGEVKVSDFGSALFGGDHGRTFVGSPIYMAPEVLNIS